VIFITELLLVSWKKIYRPGVLQNFTLLITIFGHFTSLEMEIFDANLWKHETFFLKSTLCNLKCKILLDTRYKFLSKQSYVCNYCLFHSHINLPFDHIFKRCELLYLSAIADHCVEKLCILAQIIIIIMLPTPLCFCKIQLSQTRENNNG
jgi:hypothetical protein